MLSLIGLYIIFLMSSNVYVSRRLNGYLNFYSFFSLEFTLKIFLSLLGAHIVDEKYFESDFVTISFVLSFLFIGSFFLGSVTSIFTYRGVGLLNLFPQFTMRLSKNARLYSKIFFFLGVALFFILAHFSGAGLLWLTDSRFAYQHYREGVGVYYILSQFSLYLSFIATLYVFSKRNFIIKSAILIVFFLFVFYFFGSKRSMITILLIFIVYYHYNVKEFTYKILLTFFLGLVLVFIVLQGMYSNYGLEKSVTYFNYFSSMATMVERIGDGFMYGSALLSSLWMFVPRAFYDEKPTAYALGIVSEIVAPGSTSNGNFVGTLPWALYYLDFGFIGVIFFGLISGYLLKHIHVMYIRNKSNLLYFVLFFQLCYSDLLKHLPVFAIFAALYLISCFLRLKLSAKV